MRFIFLGGYQVTNKETCI